MKKANVVHRIALLFIVLGISLNQPAIGRAGIDLVDPTISPEQVLPARLVREADTRAGLSEQISELTLFAARPGSALKTHAKRSIRQLDEATASRLGITVEKMNQAFRLNTSSFESWHVLANVANGFVDESSDRTDPAARYHILIFPASYEVIRLIAQEEKFGEGVGSHFQLRLGLSGKILLVSQQDLFRRRSWPAQIVDHSAAPKDLLIVPDSAYFAPGDLIYSLNAVRVAAGLDDWGLLSGALGEFATAYSISTTPHMAALQTTNNYIEQYELEFTQAQAQAILRNLISYSHQMGETGLYNIVYNSCITAFLEAIYAGGVGLPIATTEFNPYRVVAHLRAAGVVKNQIASLNEELSIGRPQLETPENARLLKMVAALEPVLNTPAFGNLIRQLTLLIVQERITHADLEAVRVCLRARLQDPAFTAACLVDDKASNKVQRLLAALGANGHLAPFVDAVKTHLKSTAAQSGFQVTDLVKILEKLRADNP